MSDFNAVTKDGRVVPGNRAEIEVCFPHAPAPDGTWYSAVVTAPARPPEINTMRLGVNRGKDGEIWDLSVESADWRWPPHPLSGFLSETLDLGNGTAVSTMSLPLTSDHWSRLPGCSPPPMFLRCGLGPARDVLKAKIVEAARHAYRAATMRGTATLDPDALVQNLVVAMLGYCTEDGLSLEGWENPCPIPPRVDEQFPKKRGAS